MAIRSFVTFLLACLCSFPSLVILAAALAAARDELTAFAIELKVASQLFENPTSEFLAAMRSDKGFTVGGIRIHSQKHVEDVMLSLAYGLVGREAYVDERGKRYAEVPGLIERKRNHYADNCKKYESGE